MTVLWVSQTLIFFCILAGFFEAVFFGGILSDEFVCIFNRSFLL